MLASYLARLSLALAAAPLRGRIGPLEESRIPLRVWPTDIDAYLHLNNGRYLTLMDVGRFDLVVRNRMGEQWVRRRWVPVAGAAAVRFRRELRAFQRFELASRIGTWDEKWLYIEHRMLRGEAVHAWGAVKMVIRHRRKPVPAPEIMAAAGVTSPAPEPGDELGRWIAAQGR